MPKIWHLRKCSQNALLNCFAYGSMKSRFGRMASCPQERKLGVLAGGFESGRSFPASQPPHPKSFRRPKAVSKSRSVRLMLAHLPFLRRPSQLPVSLPGVSSTARRQFSLHQFPVRIAPFRRHSVMLSLRSTPRPLVSLRLATLFHLERELGVLAGGFESSRSFTTSQPPHP